jgi:hypothetical protein
MTEVPTVTVSGLSDSEKRAVVIADNRLPEHAADCPEIPSIRRSDARRRDPLGRVAGGA